MIFNKKFLTFIINIISFFLVTPVAFSAPASNIIYNETYLGGSLWQYDYTFYNTSTNNEYLYSVDLLFDQWANVNGYPLPTGWDSTVWEGSNYTDFIISFSTQGSYDIAAGDSLDGFSFTVDYQAGDIAYNAYFDDHQGGITSTSGYTSLVPEPISSVLFVIGGAFLAGRRFCRGR